MYGFFIVYIYMYVCMYVCTCVYLSITATLGHNFLTLKGLTWILDLELEIIM